MPPIKYTCPDSLEVSFKSAVCIHIGDLPLNSLMGSYFASSFTMGLCFNSRVSKKTNEINRKSL